MYPNVHTYIAIQNMDVSHCRFAAHFFKPNSHWNLCNALGENSCQTISLFNWCKLVSVTVSVGFQSDFKCCDNSIECSLLDFYKKKCNRIRNYPMCMNTTQCIWMVYVHKLILVISGNHQIMRMNEGVRCSLYVQN